VGKGMKVVKREGERDEGKKRKEKKPTLQL
jgi:hypothetical protein